MNERTLTDIQIKAAFVARSEGSLSHDLAERIHAETSRTRQASRLTVLAGGLTENVGAQRLLWAAAISATSLALVGGLLLAGRQPDEQAVVPPPSPTVTPSEVPQPSDTPSESPAPSESPEPTPSVEPTPTPVVVVDPGLAVDQGAITLTGDLRVRSLPTVGESSAKLEPLIPAGVPLLVIEQPVVADGYTWYHVIPRAPGYPTGWVAAGSRDGEAWIGADQPTCPGWPMDATDLRALGPFGGLVCYGNKDIEVTGSVTCDLADVDFTIVGPSWFHDNWTCSFILDDSQLFFYPTPNVAVGFPTTEVPYVVTGHFADQEASVCVWGVDPPAPDPAEIAAACRADFVVTDMRSPQ
jgi:hypothetical protein